MAYEKERLLDKVGWRILRELQEDGRLPMAELARRVNLSPPAVAERVRRMEEAGIIAGYRAEVGLGEVGLPITAFVRFVETDYGAGVRATELVEELPEVLECHRVTGENSLIMKVAVSSVPHLEAVIHRLARRGQLTSSIVLSSLVEGRIVGPDALRTEGPDGPGDGRPGEGDAP